MTMRYTVTNGKYEKYNFAEQWRCQSGSSSCQSRSPLTCRRLRFHRYWALFLPPWPPPWHSYPSGTSTLPFRCRLERNMIYGHDILVPKCERDDKNSIGNSKASWATNSMLKMHVQSTCTTNWVPTLKMNGQALKQMSSTFTARLTGR